MKSMYKVIALSVVLSGSFFYLGKKSNTPMQTTEASKKFSHQVSTLEEARTFASTKKPSASIIALNNIIYSVTSFEAVKPVAIQLEAKATELLASPNLDPKDKPAIMIYRSAARVIPHLEGLAWRLGKVAQKSEFVYMGIIGTLTDIAYNNFMYSKPVDHFLEYLVRPVPGQKRFKSIPAVQDYVMTKVIPLIESEFIAPYEKLLNDHKAWNSFNFQYDRALISGGIDFSSPEAIDRSFSSQGDRYATFTRAYLSSAMGYGKNAVAALYLFCSYDLKDLSELLNKAFYEAVVRTKIRGVFTDWIRSSDKHNIKLNTHKDYKKYLKSYPRLFTLRESGQWSNGSEIKGQEYRTKAHKLFIEANAHDLEYIKQMHEQAQFPNQDNYIVDAKEMIALERNSIEHYEKLGNALRGDEIFTDEATGKSVKVNFARFFDNSLNKDLKVYYPNGFDFGRQKDFHTKINNQPTYIYTYGRPNSWPDATFGGVLPDANNENLRELYRRLMYNGDIGLIANVLFGYVL